jgi:hypothetical protein
VDDVVDLDGGVLKTLIGLLSGSVGTGVCDENVSMGARQVGG